jgi:hypothetical protein
MIFLHYKIKEFLENLKRSLDVAMRDTFIMSALATIGWTETILDQGFQIHQNAQELFEKQIKEKGEQVDARQRFEEFFDEVHDIYMLHIKFCRSALRRTTKLKEFGLDVPREKSINGWLMQAKAFYANALKSDELIESLAAFAVTRENLEEGQGKILELEGLKEQHDIETGEAQDATRQRDEAVEEAYTWAGAYQWALKYCLKDRPENLEKVLIKSYSPGYPPKEEPEEESPTDEPAPVGDNTGDGGSVG